MEGPPNPKDPKEAAFEKFEKSADKLNLAGLLNVLDGVVDTPERMLVLTSNHPEKLDPALIRPGRVDKQILLSYIGAPSAAAMLTHYFDVGDGLTTDQHQLLEQLLGDDGLQMTPAKLEQLCSEHDKVDGLLNALNVALQETLEAEGMM
eukprot:6344250-Prymnesium_polylepis.1